MSAAGGLRHRVALLQRVQAPDTGTGLAETFLEVATVWGKVEATRGSIYIGTLQVGEAITHRIMLRHTDPTAFSHLAVDGVRYRVRDARDPDGRRRWLEVMAQEERPLA